MKTAEAVIGANFGDEGKGLITDFFASQYGEEAVVVRYNGGAQAGHTVVTPEGQRHIFSHFSCGSFTGAHSFLSRFFVCNPLLFMKEYALLQAHCRPVVHIDGAAMVTTPYDMMINQIAEETRGNGRHGSCGMGFGETVERHVRSHHALTYADLFDKPGLKKKLQAIRKEWLPARLSALGITALSEQWQERILTDGVLDKYMADTETFLQLTTLAVPDYLEQTSRKIVFEGAQGLLLDQERGYFPHVTRSYTGIRNILALATEAGIENLTVAYVTRSYMTRHGAGPLSHELPRPPHDRVKDETNITNAYQGTLRFGWLDAALLGRTIQDDLSDHCSALKVQHGLAVSCLDQWDDQVTFVEDDRVQTQSRDAFLETLRHCTEAEFIMTSTGPSRKNVSFSNRLAI